MSKARKRPGDATGRKAEELAQQHADELKRRQGEIALINALEAQRADDVVDLTNGEPDLDDQNDVLMNRLDGDDDFPTGLRSVTQQPGQAGTGAIAADGTMTTYDGKATVKTNSTALTGGTGPETPTGVPGGTVSDQRVRNVVDTLNVTKVNTPNFGIRGVADVEDLGPVEAGPRMATNEGTRVAENPTVVIRVNSTLEHLTFGAGTDYNFEEGRQYRVPRALADHLEEKGYVWH